MNNSARKAAAVAVLSFALIAHADVVHVDTVDVNISPPKGYCTVAGATQNEREILAKMRAGLKAGATVDLLIAFVPCADLKDFNSGKLFSFQRWSQVQVGRQGDGYRHIPMSRPDFITSATRTMTRNPPDMAKVAAKMREPLATMGVSANGQPAMAAAGSDERAAFFTMTMPVAIEGEGNTIITGFMALTTVHGLMFVLNSYEKSTAKPIAYTAPLVTSDMLDGLLKSN